MLVCVCLRPYEGRYGHVFARMFPRMDKSTLIHTCVFGALRGHLNMWLLGEFVCEHFTSLGSARHSCLALFAARLFFCGMHMARGGDSKFWGP